MPIAGDATGTWVYTEIYKMLWYAIVDLLFPKKSTLFFGNEFIKTVTGFLASTLCCRVALLKGQ